MKYVVVAAAAAVVVVYWVVWVISSSVMFPKQIDDDVVAVVVVVIVAAQHCIQKDPTCDDGQTQRYELIHSTNRKSFDNKYTHTWHASVRPIYFDF